MKLRFDETSIRCRLSPRDLRELGERGRLEMPLLPGSGPGGGLLCVLESRPGLPHPRVEFRGAVLRILVPASAARALADGGRTAEETVRGAGGGRVEILVEADRDEHCPARTAGVPCPLGAARSGSDRQLRTVVNRD